MISSVRHPARLLCSLLVGLAPLLVAAQATPHQDLQQLDQQLHQFLVEVRDTAAPDKSLRSTWQSRHQALTRQLEALETRVTRTDDPITARKLDALRALQHNLRLALEMHERGETASLAELRAQAPIASWATSKAAPANDTCLAAQPLVLGQVVTGSLDESGLDGDGTCGQPGARDVWFRYRADTRGTLGFDSSGSSFDTVVSLHSGCPGLTTNELACSDDDYGLQAAAYYILDAGQEVFIRLAGFDPTSTGNYQLRVGERALVEGRVSRDSDGAPLQTRVQLCSRDTGFNLASGGSDATGMYRVGALPGRQLDSGPAYLHTWQTAGHVDELYDDLPRPSGLQASCGREQLGALLPLQAGEVLSGLDLSLARGGSLSGQIHYADGRPAGGIDIRIYFEDGREFGRLKSRLEGDYQLDGLPAGEYFVRLLPADGKDFLYGDIACPRPCDPLTGQPVRVEQGHETSGVDIVLESWVEIRGRVTDADGQPLTGASVGARQADLRQQPFMDRRTETDANGEYLLRNLPAYGFFLYATAQSHFFQYYDSHNCLPGSECELIDAAVVDLQPTGRHYPSALIDFELLPRPVNPSSLQGRLTESGGNPLADRQIKAYEPEADRTLTSTTGTDGSYRLPTEAGRTYYLYTNSGRSHEDQVYGGQPCPGYAEFIDDDRCDPLHAVPLVAPAAPLTGIDFQLVPHPMIRGTVTDVAGTPLMDVSVAATRVPLFDAFYPATNVTSTATDGTYTLPVPPGDHYLSFSNGIHPHIPGAAECNPGSFCPTDGATVFTVTTADLTVDLRARALGSISGRVTDTQGHGPDLLDSVVLWSVREGEVERIVSPQDDGAFHFSHLLAGEYKLATRFSTRRDELYDGLLCQPDCPDWQQGTSLVLDGSVTPLTGIDIELEALGKLRGRVWDAVSGRTVSQPDLQVWDADSGLRVSQLTISSDFQGNFEVEGLPPGTYYLSASDTGYHGQFYGGADCVEACSDETPAGTQLEVTLEQEIDGLDFHLAPYGAIAGRVTEALTGQPVSVSVRVYSPDGRVVERTSTSPADGTYTTDPLPDGEYFVGAGQTSASETGEIPQFHPGVACPDGLEGGTCAGIPPQAAAVTVSDSTTTAGIDFTLSPRTTGLNGRVFQTAGGPLPGTIGIDVWDARTGVLTAQGETDASARFSFELPPGGYFVSTHNELGLIDEVFDNVGCPAGSARQEGCDPALGTPVQVGSARFPSITLTLARGRGSHNDGTALPSALPLPTHQEPSNPTSSKATATISGTVTDITGQPLKGIQVVQRGFSGHEVTSTLTETDGSYHFTAVNSGIYLFEARSLTGETLFVRQVFDGADCAWLCNQGYDFDYTRHGGTPVPVSEGAQIDGIDFRLRPGGILTGRVLSDAASTASEYPLAGITVRFENADLSVYGFLETASDGTFSTPILPPGSYFLTAYGGNFEAQNYSRIPCPRDADVPSRPFSCTLTNGRPARVRPNQTTSGVDFFLRPAGVVTGFVTDAVSGEPLPFVPLQMVRERGTVTYQVVSNRAGRYVFEGLFDGDYVLATQLENTLFSPSDHSNVLFQGLTCQEPCEPTKGTTISVSAGVRQRIDLQLPRRPLHLFGTLRSAVSGAPLGNVRIEVYDLAGTLVDWTFSEDDGEYRFDLPPGQYHVVTSNDLSFVDQAYPDQECADVCDPTAGTPVALDFETGQRADFALRSVLAP